MGDLVAVAGTIAPFAMVLGIVWIKSRNRLEEKRMASRPAQDHEAAARRDGRVELLKDRVAVLERIVTDRGLNVAAQIEALRDSSSIDQLTRSKDRV